MCGAFGLAMHRAHMFSRASGIKFGVKPFLQRENIQKYIDACEMKLNFTSKSLFDVDHLHKRRNMVKVCFCVRDP